MPGERNSVAAIARFDLPRATSATTSAYLGLTACKREVRAEAKGECAALRSGDNRGEIGRSRSSWETS